MDDVAALDKKNQADALAVFMDIVGQRASCLKQRVTKLLTLDEQGQNQVTYLQMRVIILKKMASLPYIYTLKAGQRRSDVVRMNIINRPVTQSDIDDMIETIVDIVSAIWETRGLINKAYDTESPAAPGNRGRLRSQERELWVTAAKYFQEQYNAAYISSNAALISSTSRDNKYYTTSAKSNFIENDSNDKTCTHKGIPPAAQSRYQKQYKNYMRLFKATSQKLQCGSYLRCDLTSKRRVTNDLILMEAQRKSGRQNVSSNRNPSVTGMSTCSLSNYIY